MLLVLPLAVAVTATVAPPRTAAMLAAALVAAEAVLLVGARTVAFVQLLPATLGIACGVLVGRASSARMRAVLLPALTALALALAVVRGPDGSAVVGTFGLTLAIGALASAFVPAARDVGPGLAGGLAVACAITAMVAIRGPHPANVWDFGEERTSAEEAELSTWLAAHTPPRAMILAAPFPVIWLQAKTGHPVLLDMNTLLSMTYFPSHAEPVARLVRELFAVDYADPVGIDALLGPDRMLRPTSPVWLRTWGERPCATWRELGTRWGFDLVLAPRTQPLRLPPAWSGPTWSLYEIPRDPAACAAAGLA